MHHSFFSKSLGGKPAGCRTCRAPGQPTAAGMGSAVGRLRGMMLALLTAIVTVSFGQSDHPRLSDLPAVYIDVYYGHNVIKDLYRIARMWYVDEQDGVTFADSLMMAGRGNSTWSFDKKPYKLKLKRGLPLLPGKPAARRWVLLANAADKTMLRNAAASVCGEQTSLAFNPSYRFVDLIVNGHYEGTYQLTEAVEIGPGRVDIAKQRVPPQGDDLSGGYLLEIDGTQDGNCFLTDRCHVPIRIHEPDDDDIDMAQQTYISGVVNELERRLMSEQFADRLEGYRPLVDSLSLADWYICQELTGNGDALHNSFFYKERGDERLHFGPLWDYDIAFGNDNRLGDTTRELVADVGFGAARQWTARLWQDPWFAQLIVRRYGELLDGGIVGRMTAAVDSLAGAIGASVQLNYGVWPIDEQTYLERALYADYSLYVADLKDYIRRHAAYLQEAFAQRAADDTGIGGTATNRRRPGIVADAAGRTVKPSDDTPAHSLFSRQEAARLPRGIYIGHGKKHAVR